MNLGKVFLRVENMARKMQGLRPITLQEMLENQRIDEAYRRGWNDCLEMMKKGLNSH